MQRRCFVCGFQSNQPVCPRCSTILHMDRAACPDCGKAFDDWIATCDACGALLDRQARGPEDVEAVRALASVPGISEARAKELAAKGFRDFADVVRLALPESAIRQGLHHTIARKVLLADLVTRPERPVSGNRCLVCGAAWLADGTRCGACGSSADLEIRPDIIEQRLQEITGEIVDLATDEDFRSMPEAIRSEFLRASHAANPDDLLRDECRQQIDAWRAKGFDIVPLERLLEEDLPHFREKSVRLIRVQVLKKADAGKYRCPLCEVRLESTAEECGNCGARFS